MAAPRWAAMALTPSRRSFLGGVAAIAVSACDRNKGTSARPEASGAQANQPSSANPAASVTPQGAPQKAGTVATAIGRRPLGGTGEMVSMIGLGGYHIGIPAEDEAIRMMHRSIDAGITFFDNCWSYHKGESERRMGKALQGGKRQQVFLMTKIDGRTKDSAAKQLDQCLERLQTDMIDLVQLHEIIRDKDPSWVFGKDGAMEAMIAAKKAGKLRFIGFTGHKDPEIHMAMLRTAEKHGFKFDAVQLPLNVMDANYRSFEAKVLPTLTQQNIGVCGMKPLGSGDILKSGKVNAVECLNYALTLRASVVITGCDRPEILEQAIKVAQEFKPLTEEQMQALRDRTREAAMAGTHEAFKNTDRFDGTTKHPHWMTSAEI